MWRAIASNALTLFVLVLVAVAGLLAWGKREYTGRGPLTEAICVRVERGDSLAAVSRKLEAQRAIRDARIFRIGADYSDKAGGLKFGSYLVPPGASMAEILGVLTAGGQSTCGREVNYRIGVTASELVLRAYDAGAGRYIEVAKFVPGEGATPAEISAALGAEDMRWRVTLAEGVTSWQVVDSLRKAEFLAGTVKVTPPEGMLAPDSYEVARGSDRAALLAEMQERQAQILAELWAARPEGTPYKSPEQALVMASIVEKETGIPAERPQVASVFVNRMAKGMRLQTDPTVIYGLTEGKGVLGRGIRQSELRRKTPYNTYVIEGLPPTPIANPGRLSIEAALHPAPTNFLYFVADGSGGHAFAATLDAHNRNVAAWRKIEADNGQPPPIGVQGD